MSPPAQIHPLRRNSNLTQINTTEDVSGETIPTLSGVSPRGPRPFFPHRGADNVHRNPRLSFPGSNTNNQNAAKTQDQQDFIEKLKRKTSVTSPVASGPSPFSQKKDGHNSNLRLLTEITPSNSNTNMEGDLPPVMPQASEQDMTAKEEGEIVENSAIIQNEKKGEQSSDQEVTPSSTQQPGVETSQGAPISTIGNKHQLALDGPGDWNQEQFRSSFHDQRPRFDPYRRPRSGGPRHNMSPRGFYMDSFARGPPRRPARPPFPPGRGGGFFY